MGELVMIRLISTGLILLLVLLLSFNAAYAGDDMNENNALTKTHNKILKNYEDVLHIDADKLSEMKQEDVVVFDIREQDEFAVSHLEGAIWADPDIKASTFLKNYGEIIGDKAVILYCSVGVRSSRLAEKLQAEMTETAEIYNLEKGIFGWHNEKRPLYQTSITETVEPTDYIHPYNFVWGRMVNRGALKRTDISSGK